VAAPYDDRRAIVCTFEAPLREVKRAVIEVEACEARECDVGARARRDELLQLLR
jgi:hypothetical protein